MSASETDSLHYREDAHHQGSESSNAIISSLIYHLQNQLHPQSAQNARNPSCRPRPPQPTAASRPRPSPRTTHPGSASAGFICPSLDKIRSRYSIIRDNIQNNSKEINWIIPCLDNKPQSQMIQNKPPTMLSITTPSQLWTNKHQP